jgi:hypothetical protein
MPTRGSTQYGYLINVTKTVQDVLLLHPGYQSRVQAKGFVGCGNSMLVFAAKTYEAKCGLQFGSITVSSAWIGGGRTGLIWALPRAMMKKCRSSEDNMRLETFKSLIGMWCEPSIFYSNYEQPEPLFVQQMGPLPKEVEDMLWTAFDERFRSGEISVDSLVGDMSKLALNQVK